jgi:hypothetical protein
MRTSGRTPEAKSSSRFEPVCWSGFLAAVIFFPEEERAPPAVDVVPSDIWDAMLGFRIMGMAAGGGPEVFDEGGCGGLVGSYLPRLGRGRDEGFLVFGGSSAVAALVGVGASPSLLS